MIFLLVLLLGMSIFDAAYTTRMLRQHGTAIEMNMAVRFLANKFGLRRGVWAGVMVPTVLLGAMGLHCPAILEILVPLRGVLCGLQLGKLREMFCSQKKTSKSWPQKNLIRVN